MSGPSVSRGYWRSARSHRRGVRGEAARSTTTTYLRTGDLGAIIDGELVITGRIKDLIILRGRNIYPQDLENTASAANG